jgi:hypothetical protein
MKKLSIVLLAVFFIGISNVNAQTDSPSVNDVTTKTVAVMEEVKDVKTCAKTGKVCESTCEKKKNNTCCKGEKTKSCSKSEKSSCSKSKSSYSKNKEGSFNFDKSNDYANEKSSCSKKAKKGCCKKEATATSIK